MRRSKLREGGSEDAIVMAEKPWHGTGEDGRGGSESFFSSVWVRKQRKGGQHSAHWPAFPFISAHDPVHRVVQLTFRVVFLSSIKSPWKHLGIQNQVSGMAKVLLIKSYK